MTYQIETTAEAEADLEAILVWLHEQGAGRVGINWFLGLEDAIHSLQSLPGRCGRAPETAGFPLEIRQLKYGKPPHVYRILFTIEMSRRVRVMRVLHTRRQRLGR